ncbi:hypothetical protein K466DRAFT_607356 [Polyporus arcularius HHB13444]|uniref:Uncharacterized protein n=1 Tax=Polyporus arcularius HHB13444 TaxID=1314778 RepID=A0A5C3NLH3_9APHY|nr:hypothetical protein K466DRAFT_607356 [Polyporus arcularius HHB13444]
MYSSRSTPRRSRHQQEGSHRPSFPAALVSIVLLETAAVSGASTVSAPRFVRRSSASLSLSRRSSADCLGSSEFGHSWGFDTPLEIPRRVTS